jgi:hypothetical protein
MSSSSHARSAASEKCVHVCPETPGEGKITVNFQLAQVFFFPWGGGWGGSGGKHLYTNVILSKERKN